MSASRPDQGRDHSGLQHQEFLTVDDLARLLRVPKATIYRWRSTGHGPPGYTIGRHVRFRWAEVEAWLEERADEAGADHS
jgi:excisionase family DNA binding protein